MSHPSEKYESQLSGCQNPDDLCSIPSSLSPSLSRSFRDAGFFFRGVHVYEICFRELSRKFLERISWAPILYTHTETFVPELLLLLLPCSFSTWPSTASSRSQWALPDLNRERQISVPNCSQPPRISMGNAGPQLRSPDLSGHSRQRKRKILVGTATPLSNFWGVGHPS